MRSLKTSLNFVWNLKNAPVNPATVLNPTLLSKTANSITLKAIPGYEYSIDGIHWQSSNLIEMLIPEFEYTVYQKYSETDVYSVISNGTTFTTNDRDDINLTPDATDLVYVKMSLLSDNKSMASDYNGDGISDIRDLVRLKKYLADNTTPIGKQNNSMPVSQLSPEVANLPENKQVA